MFIIVADVSVASYSAYVRGDCINILFIYCTIVLLIFKPECSCILLFSDLPDKTGMHSSPCNDVHKSLKETTGML